MLETEEKTYRIYEPTLIRRKQPDWSMQNEKYTESELSRARWEGVAYMQLCLQKRSEWTTVKFLIASVLLSNKRQQATDFKSPMEDKTNSVIKT